MRLWLGFLVILVFISPATARSKAAQYLVDQQIAEACNGGSGTIRSEAAIERDLTGDGRADLIIDHRGIWCDGGGQSGFCGAQLCSVLIYVRRDALLKLEAEILSGSLEVSGGKIPAIHLSAHGGAPSTLQWDGKKFQ